MIPVPTRSTSRSTPQPFQAVPTRSKTPKNPYKHYRSNRTFQTTQAPVPRLHTLVWNGRNDQNKKTFVLADMRITSSFRVFPGLPSLVGSAMVRGTNQTLAFLGNGGFPNTRLIQELSGTPALPKTWEGGVVALPYSPHPYSKLFPASEWGVGPIWRPRMVCSLKQPVFRPKVGHGTPRGPIHNIRYRPSGTLALTGRN